MNWDQFQQQDNVYGFDRQLIASKGILESCDVRQILFDRLPGCVDADPTDSETDRTGVDWIATLKSGACANVDVKFRDKDCQKFGSDDLALDFTH